MIGDIHGAWNELDARWFESAGYDCVVVVGDLAGWRWSRTLQVAKAIGKMNCTTLYFPGNHDATHAMSLANEAVAGFASVRRAFSGTQSDRRHALQAAVDPHPMCGYSNHSFGDITLVCARPHSMGGPTLGFVDTLTKAYDVKTLDESAERIKKCVDEASDRLVFVSHNGPTGMGSTRDAIWGADFKRNAGDWGDPDLRVAIEHARATGKTVLAVLAGHMHRRLRGGGERPGFAVEKETTMVNAAVVPRIVGSTHHHVEVQIDGDRVTAEDRYVEMA